MLVKDYPLDFDRDRSLTNRVLTGFVTAVVPGVGQPDAAVRFLRARAYPFAAHAAFFSADLSDRAPNGCTAQRTSRFSPSNGARQTGRAERQRVLEPPHESLPLLNARVLPVGRGSGLEREFVGSLHHHEQPVAGR